MKKLLISTLILGSFMMVSPLAHAARPTAVCKDGTYSYSKHRQGTCSWHKGVRYWMK